MANKFKFSKINTAFNEYLDDANLVLDLKKFFSSKGYISGIPSTFNYDQINESQDSYELNLSSENFSTQQGKIENILKFVATNEELFEKQDIEHILSQIVYFLISNDKKLKLDEDTALTLNKYELVKIKRRKKHAWAKAIGKKVIAPALITGAITSIAGLIISATRAVIGSSELISTVAGLEIAGVATAGFSIGFLATIATILIKNSVTRSYYHNKYGIKSHNFSLLNKAEVNNIEDIKSLNLPIIQLLDKIVTTDATLRELTIAGTGWRHPINTIKSFFLTKVNRNRMHEVVGFTKLLSSKIVEGNPEEINVKYTLLRNVIEEYKNEIMEARIGSMIKVRDAQNTEESYSVNKTQIYEYSDILAKEEIAQSQEKATSGLVCRRALEIMSRKVTDRLTGGEEYVRDLEAEAKEKAAKRAITQSKTTAKKALLGLGEREMLEALETNDTDIFVTGTGLSSEDIIKIKELLTARLKTSTGKIKKNPSPLISSKALKNEDVSLGESYAKLADFIKKNSDLLTLNTTI